MVNAGGAQIGAGGETARAAAWTPDPGDTDEEGGGFTVSNGSRRRRRPAAGGLRIRSWSRRVDAKKGGGGEKRGGRERYGAKGSGWVVARSTL